MNAQGWLPAVTEMQYPPFRFAGSDGQLPEVHDIVVPLTVNARGLTKLPQLPPARFAVVW